MSLSSDRYALFRKLEDGAYFIALFDEADKARKRMQELARHDNNDYFIQDIIQNKRIDVVARLKARAS